VISIILPAGQTRPAGASHAEQSFARTVCARRIPWLPALITAAIRAVGWPG
jgi:hypothetical protein